MITESGVLDLSFRNLTTIPVDVFFHRDKIVHLNLDNNSLKSVPKQIGEFTKLESLTLFNNRLQTIPKELSRVPNLQSLDVSHNRLESLPIEVLKMKSLKCIKADKDISVPSHLQSTEW